MRIENGKVTSFEFAQSPDYDLPSRLMVPPPAPLHTYLHSNYWQLRDANWWADFPSTVAQIDYFWNLLGREPLDGVIAIDQDAVELLLADLGAVDVPDYGERIDATNMRERLDAYVHGPQNYESEEQRKAFVGALSRAVLEQVLAASPETAVKLGSALRTALDEKHMLFLVRDEPGAAMLSAAGWDGALLPYEGHDYLYVTHSNLTPNKHSRKLEQWFEYEVGRDGQGAIATLTINLKNHMQPMEFDPERDWIFERENFYRDYVRVFVPQGAELLEASGFTDPPTSIQECGRTVFEGAVELNTGESEKLVLTYSLPDYVAQSLAAGNYTLTLQKQPGTVADGARVRIEGMEQISRTMRLDRFLQVENGEVTFRERPSLFSRVTPGQPVCTIHDQPPLELAPPQRIVIEKATVDAEVVVLGVDQQGVMQIPENGEVVGWYDTSAHPGYPGNSVFAGHVDWEKKIAVLWDLREVEEGDEIKVLTTRGDWKTYVVEHNWLVPFDAPAGDVVGPTYSNWMTIITCDGEFDQETHNYLNRRVVRAVLAPGQSADLAQQ